MKIILLACLLVCGCAASGPTYTNFTQPTDGNPKIIIYRGDHTFGSTTYYWVEINAKQVCDLHNASFMVHSAKLGTNIITSSLFGRTGTSRLELDLKSQETVYVRMDVKSGRIWGELFGGIPDAAIEGASSSAGPVELTQVSKPTAESEMADLNHEEDCK